MLISPFLSPLPVPCGCGLRLAWDQACVRHSQGPAPEQPDQELVAGGSIDRAGVALGVGAGEGI